MTRVKCPSCAHEFAVDTRSTTQRSLQPMSDPIRDDVPVCKHCGLIERLHQGNDNLAIARGCVAFEAQ